MLFEGAVVAIIKEQGGDYGLQVRLFVTFPDQRTFRISSLFFARQKLFGTAGAVIFGPLAGKVIDWGGGDYSSIFYLYFALRCQTAVHTIITATSILLQSRYFLACPQAPP